jgi:hypothetical protein
MYAVSRGDRRIKLTEGVLFCESDKEVKGENKCSASFIVVI